MYDWGDYTLALGKNKERIIHKQEPSFSKTRFLQDSKLKVWNRYAILIP
jgi:hypothetical protein